MHRPFLNRDCKGSSNGLGRGLKALFRAARPGGHLSRPDFAVKIRRPARGAALTPTTTAKSPKRFFEWPQGKRDSWFLRSHRFIHTVARVSTGIPVREGRRKQKERTRIYAGRRRALPAAGLASSPRCSAAGARCGAGRLEKPERSPGWTVLPAERFRSEISRMRHNAPT